jgi:hypothetical protein
MRGEGACSDGAGLERRATVALRVTPTVYIMKHDMCKRKRKVIRNLFAYRTTVSVTDTRQIQYEITVDRGVRRARGRVARPRMRRGSWLSGVGAGHTEHTHFTRASVHYLCINHIASSLSSPMSALRS